MFNMLNALLDYRRIVSQVSITNYNQEEYVDIVDAIYLNIIKELRRKAQEDYDATMAGMSNLEETKLLSIINRLDAMITSYKRIEKKGGNKYE